MNTAAQEGIARLTLSLKVREGWLVVIESATYSAVVLTAFLGNIMLALAFYKTSSLRARPQNYYLLSLAATDILNAVNCSISLAVLITGKWPFGHFICQLQGSISLICGGVSLLTLGMIAINRYVMICWSSSLYRKIYSKRNVLISITNSWILTVCLVYGAFFAHETLYHFHPGKCWCFQHFDIKENIGLYFTCCYSLTVSLTVSSIIFSYYKVFRKIRAHFIQVGNSSLHQNDNSTAFAEELKITAMLFTTILAFLICWTPSVIIDFYEVIVGYYTLPREVYMLNMFTFVSSSAVNPVIYGLMKREFKVAYKKVLGCEDG